MPRRVHPRPWLRVVELIIVKNCLTQMFEGDIVVAAMIFHFPVQHFGGDAKDGTRLVVHNQAISWDINQRFVEFCPLNVGQVVFTQRRIRNAARLAHHGRRYAI